MFEFEKHRREYIYDYYTVIPGVLPAWICQDAVTTVRRKAAGGGVQLVDHEKQGSSKELDYGGKYRHHIFKGDDVRRDFSALVGLYYGLTNLVAVITSQDVITSPHKDSDVNIKAYPADGGTIGWHEDTNGITVLIYLTTNTEGGLLLELPREHPETGKHIEERQVFAVAGSMLLMQGRKVRHMSAPLQSEEKMVGVFNYYVNGDTWRPEGFDHLVYEGKPTQ